MTSTVPGSRAEYFLAGVLLATSGGAWSEDTTEDAADNADAVPDMEFLEYLGSWEDSDEEWMLFAGEDDAPAERTDPAPDGEASVESNDER
jgi:hypothetical protein